MDGQVLDSEGLYRLLEPTSVGDVNRRTLLALTAAGIALTLAGAVTVAYPLLDSEIRRRERRYLSYFTHLKEKFRLQGAYKLKAPFVTWPPHRTYSAMGFPIDCGIYAPGGVDDSARMADNGRWYGIGPRTVDREDEAVTLGSDLRMTDRRIGILGLLGAVVGAVLAIGGAALP